MYYRTVLFNDPSLISIVLGLLASEIRKMNKDRERKGHEMLKRKILEGDNILEMESNVSTYVL